MKFKEFFSSNRGTWVLTGLLIVLLMTIAVYPDFWAADIEDNQSAEVIPPPAREETAEIIEPGVTAESNAITSADDDGETTDADEEAVSAAAAPSEWLLPLSGQIGRNHGFSQDKTFNDYRFHHGIDIMAEPGSPVYAAATGTVTIAREDSYWGGFIVIEHGGGWESIYRCLTPAVSYSTAVEAGQLLGYIIETSQAEAGEEAHLHFELYLEGNEVDPVEWL